jgi:membrane protein YqaA with SNARE-associated domain
MVLILAAALWGFAEATLFFVVPDVLLSAIALRDRRTAVRASYAAVLAAMIGGTLMYFWGAQQPETALKIVTALPAIGPGVMAHARDGMVNQGTLAIVLGPLTATPYKSYAVQASAIGMPCWLLLLITPIARLPRFLLVSLLVGTVARVAAPYLSIRTLYAIWLVAWLALYSVLWTRV